MKSLFFLLFFLPTFLYAQTNEKYMAGAVPLQDGKIVFTKTIQAPSLSQEQIYNIVLNWAKARFTVTDKQKGRVAYTNEEKGEIACLGEEYLVFSNKALSLDRSLTNYQFSIVCEPEKCNLRLNTIRYTYNPVDKMEHYKAEEIITDDYALNKKKDKLLRIPGKFRIATIDLVNELFDNVQQVINQTTLVNAKKKQQPVVNTIPPTPAPSSILLANSNTPTSPQTGSLQGYKQIYPEQIPGNIIKLLSQDWMLITAGNDQQYNTMTASWGGLGYLYNKPITLCFINPARYTYQFMEESETYTLSFYTEAYRDALQYCGTHSGKDNDKIKAAGLTPITTPLGSKAFSEAWMIIECRKMVAQSLTPEALFNKKLQQEWNGKAMHKMYIGEILNVWVK